jgi:sugar/nucleoside kinase (ribokinase family)
VRAGLGGGSPQAALAAQLWDDKSKVGLVAPVGQKFDQAMLQGLDLAGVDTKGVTRLTGYVTPRMQIRYDSDKTVWTPGEGWDRWEELKQENLPLAPELDGAPLVHIITEGSGGAETQMAFDYLARNPPALLSIEPVMPDVSAGAVEALTPHAAAADLVCPDWETALGISHLQGCAGLDVRGSDAHAHLMRRYEVVPGLTHGGRPVYCAEADGALPRGFLYHVPGSAGASRWYLGPKVGSDVACLFVASEAVTPDLVRGPWQEYHAAAQEWREAPEMDVVRVAPPPLVLSGHAASLTPY